MFQGLRTGGLFYVLEKGDELKLRIGHVVSVSNPQPKYNQVAAIPSYSNQPEMVVDVKVKIGEETIDFKQLNEEKIKDYIDTLYTSINEDNYSHIIDKLFCQNNANSTDA